MKKFLVILCVTIVQVAAAQQDWSPVATTGGAVDRTQVKVVQKLGSQLPMQANFRDQNGAPLTFGQIAASRPVIILPVFYRCQGVCSLEFQNLLGVFAKDHSPSVGRDVDVVILGIDPVERPKDAMAKFETANKQFPNLLTGNGWHFLTGDLANIRSVTDALGFYYKFDPKTDTINHPSGLMFVTPAGVVSSYILTPNYSAAAFKSDLLLARQSKVGAKVDDVFFGCIHIDPLTGKRSLVFEKVLRLTGAVFLVVAIASITLMSRKKVKPTQTRA